MDGNATLTIVILVFLIAGSAFFSASETAYTCLNRVRLKNMANSGDKRAAKVLALAEDYDRLISSILIGNNIVNILATSLATALFVKALGNNGVTVSTIVMTITVLLFGEITPKSVARVMNEKIAFAFFPVLFAIIKLLTPVNYVMGCWQKLLGKVIRNKEEHGITEEELITMVEEAENDGGIDEHESELIRSAIEFNDLCVEDILTPRVDVVAVDVEDSEEEIANCFAESGFSRLPVYEESVDNIIGILHEKDFYRKRDRLNVREMMTNPICVMPTTQLSALLKLLQQQKGHMAVVMDEYGGVSGIVTLEDILEELVGDIYDEHDDVVEEFNQVNDNTFQVDCSTDLDEFCEHFDIKAESEMVSLGGWVAEQLGKIPEIGDHFRYEALEITVTAVDSHRAETVNIIRLPHEDAEESTVPANA